MSRKQFRDALHRILDTCTEPEMVRRSALAALMDIYYQPKEEPDDTPVPVGFTVPTRAEILGTLSEDSTMAEDDE